MALKMKKPLGAATMTKAMVDGKAKTTIAEETHQEQVAAPEPVEEPASMQTGVAGLAALGFRRCFLVWPDRGHFKHRHPAP